MANRIKLKRSTVPGRIPNPADLDVGEIAVNTADAVIYTKHSDNTIVTISGGTTNVTAGNTNIYNGRTTVDTNVTLVDSFSATGATSVRWTISSYDSVNNKYKTSTVDSTNNGSSVFYNEYGIVLSDSLVEVATFTANITGGNINLYALGESANVSVTYQRTILGSSTLEGYISGVSYVQSVVGSGTATSCIVDSFTGTGSQTAFTLSTTPANENQTLVSVGGILQPKSTYSLSGTTLTFSSAPDNGVGIEVISFVTTTVTGYTGSAGANGTNGYTGSAGAVGYTGSAAAGVLGYSGSSGGGAIDGNLYVSGDTVISGNIIPDANITYSLGSSTNRFKDLYLSGNTLYLGSSTFSATDIFPFNLDIQPEVLTIQVQADQAGDSVEWQWTWVQSTLPFARTTITNQFQASVPLYNQGTYQINNFAGYETFGSMTQAHLGYFKWIEGAGTQNLVSWANTYTTANISHPDINSGNVTQVQRYNIQVPSTITLPNLTPPTISYNISVSNGQYLWGGDAAAGYNVNLGPVYRGGTYTFNLDSSLAGHSFYLTTDNGTNFVANAYVGEYTTGVTGSRNNGSTGQTTLVFQVPQNAPDTLYYQCATHSSMRGALTIKDLAVETNVNGNYIIYFQHSHEGHRTPIEIRPIPSLVNQMCVVYDQAAGKFVPQDLATYVENTPSFKNKIREVAGTATLIAPNGVAVVPTVLVVEDASYLPLVNNKDGDIAFDAYYSTMYVWSNNAWRSTKPTVSNGYTGSAGVGYTGSAGTQGTIGYTGSAGTGGTPSISGFAQSILFGI